MQIILIIRSIIDVEKEVRHAANLSIATIVDFLEIFFWEKPIKNLKLCLSQHIYPIFIVS